MESSTIKEIPTDLRSSKRKGRPSKEERSSAANLERLQRELAADFLQDLKSSRKAILPGDKITFINNVMRMAVKNDDLGRDENEITFNMLGSKYVDIQVRIKEGNKSFIDAEQKRRTISADSPSKDQ